MNQYRFLTPIDAVFIWWMHSRLHTVGYSALCVLLLLIRNSLRFQILSILLGNVSNKYRFGAV